MGTATAITARTGINSHNKVGVKSFRKPLAAADLAGINFLTNRKKGVLYEIES
jgi:hypothetical protein